MNLTFRSNGQRGEISGRTGILLSELSAEAGFPLNMQCGGQGACRGCMVRLITGTFQTGDTVINAPAEARACKTIVLSENAEIEIPSRSLLRIGSCASADFYAPRKKLFQCLPAMPVSSDVERSEAEGENSKNKLGIAVDIGTTTVAAILVELSTGKILARESAYNRQIELADNIASRIALCTDDENLKKLQRLIISETLFPMLGKLAGQNFQTLEKTLPSEREAPCRNAVAFQGLENVDAVSSPRFQTLENVVEIVFSGNTVMSHLALGLSALSIGTIPFEPLTKIFSEHAAPEIGLACCPNARVRTVPSIAGYVGGDIVSDLYVADLNSDRLELLVDIGTNGEIVLNDHGKLLATATAAGPAFEGAGLLHGCRADTGVIEKIVCNVDDSIDVKTIGDQPAVGLCGSAAVDFIASAFQTGLLNLVGRFDLDRLRAAGRLVQLDSHGMAVNACVIVPQEQSGLDEAVLITEFDVSQILKAKAAVYAGIRTLLERAGKSLADVERLILAGGFAAHLHIENAITIGLLPEIPLEKYDVIGNGSLAGAYASLGASEVWKELHQIAQVPDSCHLAETDEFENRFVDALALPNFDPDEFPETMAKFMENRI